LSRKAEKDNSSSVKTEEETSGLAPAGWVLVATFGAAHGIKGEVRVKYHTADPQALVDYSPLRDESFSRSFTFLSARKAGEVAIARVKDITDRNQAETLTHINLYAERSKLPPPDEDEFYHADLIGLRVEGPDGELIGTVQGIYDFGAGEMLDIRRPRRKGVMIPFTREIFPTIDIAGGRAICMPPKGLLADEAPPPDWEL
jgi:16S rRNA processing protein RimM